MHTDLRRPTALRAALAALALAALACGGLGVTPPPATPTPPPSATAFSPGVEATATPGAAEPPTNAPPTAAAASPTAAATTAAPTAPAVTPGTVPAPEDLGPEAILILAPRFLASVASPVRVAGEAEPTFEQTLVVLVSDADGNPLATQPTTIQADVGQRGAFAAEVSFAVAADQPGRISVYHASPKDGGLVHLASIEVNLLASGSAAASQGEAHPEELVIFAPDQAQAITGGVVPLRGFSGPVFENNLGVALCGEGGSGAPDLICGTADNVLFTGSAMVQAPDIGQPGPFEVAVPYSASGPVNARVVVFSTSARDGGLLHLASRDVQISP